MSFALPAIFAVLTLAGAVAALTLRNLVHSALSLTFAFAGLGGLYVVLGAEFAGLAQVLVYAGGVAILIVFAVLLVRERDEEERRPIRWGSVLSGAAVSVLVFAAIARCILSTPGLHSAAPAAIPVGIRDIGTVMMSDDALPLEIIGILLTAAMLGAVIIALAEKKTHPPQADKVGQ
jgi:NADH-quinone oxidoreductase subunit J